MKNMKRILLLWMLFVSISLSAQDWAVKTNLLYDATATINLGAEIGLAHKWTLDLSANYNGWTFNDNKKWKHWLAQPEARYCVRTLEEPGKLPLRRLVCRCRPGLRLPVAVG